MSTWASILVSLSGTLLTLGGLYLNHRFQWMGKRAEVQGTSDGKRIEQETTLVSEVFDRLDRAEEQNKQCEKDLKAERAERLKSEFDMRTEMQTLELISDILIARCPGAETEVVEIRERMKARKAKLRDEIFVSEFDKK